MKKNSNNKNILNKCHICGRNVYVDQFGQGNCEHCGWYQGQEDGEWPDQVIYPNMVSYNKAKRLYADGKSFIPSLEDFVEGLFFYSEMEFHYHGRRYGVVFGKGYTINFYEFNKEEGYQTYENKKEFMEKANIKGNLLKDLWNEVENANYMSCA